MPRPTKAAAKADEQDTANWFANLHDDTTPTEPVVALVRPRSNRSTDAVIALAVTRLAVLAELDHFADAYSYQVKTVAALAGIVADMTSQLADRRLVDPTLIQQGRTQFEGLAAHGRVEDNEDGGS
jgi:hypothetical protein